MSNEIPKDVYTSLARLIYPQILEFYKTEEGQKIRIELNKQENNNTK